MILDVRPFCRLRQLCVDFVYFLIGFYSISCHLGCLNRNIAELLYGFVSFLQKILGCLFLCFCRCPNYVDFLLQFTFQDAPKLVLATLGSFGPSGGVTL
jgi:hypothetical protein